MAPAGRGPDWGPIPKIWAKSLSPITAWGKMTKSDPAWASERSEVPVSQSNPSNPFAVRVGFSTYTCQFLSADPETTQIIF